MDMYIVALYAKSRDVHLHCLREPQHTLNKLGTHCAQNALRNYDGLMAVISTELRIFVLTFIMCIVLEEL